MRHIFAHNLTYLRHQLGMSNTEFADAIGITVQRLNAWEKGDCFPKYSAMIKLCDFIGNRDIYSLITQKITQ